SQPARRSFPNRKACEEWTDNPRNTDRSLSRVRSRRCLQMDEATIARAPPRERATAQTSRAQLTKAAAPCATPYSAAIAQAASSSARLWSTPAAADARGVQTNQYRRADGNRRLEGCSA